MILLGVRKRLLRHDGTASDCLADMDEPSAAMIVQLGRTEQTRRDVPARWDSAPIKEARELLVGSVVFAERVLTGSTCEAPWDGNTQNRRSLTSRRAC